MPFPAALILAGAAAAAALIESGGSNMSSGLSDEQLWQLIYSGQNPLAGMRYSDAVLHDPRRIEGIMAQRVIQSMRAATGDSGSHMMGMAYLDAARAGGGPGRSIARITDIQEQNWGPYLRALTQPGMSMPEPMREALKGSLPALAQGFGEAIQVGVRASAIAQAAGRLEDAILWQRLAGAYRNMARAYLGFIATGRSVIEPGTPMVPLLPPPDLGLPLDISDRRGLVIDAEYGRDMIEAGYDLLPALGAASDYTRDAMKLFGEDIPDWYIATLKRKADGDERGVANRLGYPAIKGPFRWKRDRGTESLAAGEEKRMPPGHIWVHTAHMGTPDQPAPLKLLTGYIYQMAHGNVTAAYYDNSLGAVSSFAPVVKIPAGWPGRGSWIPEPEFRAMVHEMAVSDLETRPETVKARPRIPQAGTGNDSSFGSLMQSGFRDTGVRGGYGDPAELGWRGEDRSIEQAAAAKRKRISEAGLRFDVDAI